MRITLTEPLVQVVMLAVSLAGLASASHFTIKSIEQLIERTGLSDASAGFIILAVLTSTPEIIVTLFAVLQGNPAVSIGTVLGSNVFNIGLVLGVLAIIGSLTTCCTELLVELADILFITSVIPLLLVISHYHIIDVSSPIIGLLLLGVFIVNTFLITRKRTPPVELETLEQIKKGKLSVIIAKLLFSFIIVVISADLTVVSASNITFALGIPSILIGAKIVAVGTSLPELTLDLIAVRRGRVQLAIGDIIGSNLTNLTLVLGVALLTSPFQVDMTIFTEILPFLLVTTIIFWRFLMRGGVSKTGGALLILTYILFQVVIT